MKVSVAICTWNRAALLDQTLAEMTRLQVPAGVSWELLVVNNNCTDATDEVIARHASHLPVRRLLETKQGQSNARNCAIAGAAGDFIIWTDDDVLVDPNWLVEYVKATEQWPHAMFFGGTVDPWFAVEPPQWIRSNFAELSIAFAGRQLGPEVRPLAGTELPFGANMAFRREVFATCQFNPRLGLCRDNQMRGEETELMRGLQKLGHQGVWVGTARVRHYIPAERLTKKYLWDWFRGSGRLLARQQSYTDCKWLWGAPRWALMKYWRARVESWCLAPFRGARWFRAFREAALCRGIIEEARTDSTARFSPDLLPAVPAAPEG